MCFITVGPYGRPFSDSRLSVSGAAANGVHRVLSRIFAITPIAAALVTTAPAHAASLQKIEQSVWGTTGLPSYVNMYLYVPDKPAAKPPILVAAHHCQGTGQGTFNETKSNLVPLADKNGFIMIFPEATGHNCWDVGSDKALKHDGGGDTHAIAQMVRYTLTKYNGDASRVYAFGGSSGAMMTEALMGIYPDIFAGGVGISGVPCGCWAEQYSGDVATNGQWSGPCAGGNVTKTAEQWGDLVRSMFPGYSGHRPRLQLWHGDPDNTISYKNMLESIKEWTNVLGLSTTPTATDTSKANTTHQSWKNSCGYTVLETFAVKGADHAVNWDVNTVAGFLGLDKAGGSDPEAAACSGAGGSGSSGGSGNSGGAGGSTSAVATTKSNGGAGNGSVVASQGGRDGGRGGASSGKASSLSSGTRAAGGSSANSRASDEGGASANAEGGSRSDASTSASTKTSATDGTGGTGDNTTRSSGSKIGSGGNTVRSSSSVKDSGAMPATGGAKEQSGEMGQGGAVSSPDGAPSEGCSCVVTASTGRSASSVAGLMLAFFGLILRRQRRTSR